MFTAIGLAFVLAGVVFTIKAARDAGRMRQARRDWVETVGTVLSDTTVQTGGGMSALVEFTTREGRTMRAVAESVLQTGVDASGRRVRVWYDPHDPERVLARIRTGDMSAVPGYVLGAGLAVLGAVALLVG